MTDLLDSTSATALNRRSSRPTGQPQPTPAAAASSGARGEFDRVLTSHEAARLLGIHVRSLRRLVHDGEAPERVKLSQRRFGFRMSAIDRWLAERVVRPEVAG